MEAPICLPTRDFVLGDISVEEQLAIREIDPNLLLRVGTNDAMLKNHLVLLEDLIEAHDEPLGSCD